MWSERGYDFKKKIKFYVLRICEQIILIEMTTFYYINSKVKYLLI